MRTYHFYGLFIILILCLTGQGWSAIDPDKLQVTATNTLRYENYGISGDRGSASYPADQLGSQIYDEFTINTNYQKTPFNFWRTELSGLINHSEYRSKYREVVLERWHILNENGESSLPYRAEAGDFMGFFTPRTMQRSLKGAQFELQPQDDDLNHSLVFLLGCNQASWMDMHPEDEYTLGASYLLARESNANLGLNLAYTRKKDLEDRDRPFMEHLVYSIDGLKKMQLWQQELTWEGEIAYYNGEIEQDKKRDSMGYFLQVSGKNKSPLTYRLRFEDYGQYFTPPGSSVSADRRSYEAHAGWQFPIGVDLNARYQLSQSNIYSDNRQDTNIYGLTFSGPLPGQATFNLDSFLKKTKDQQDTNQDTYSTTLNLSKALTKQLNGRISGSFTRTHYPDKSPDITRGVTTGLDWSPAISDASLTISPTMGVQEQRTGNGKTLIYSRGLNINFSRDKHSLSTSLNMQSQNIESAEDVDSYTWNVNYSYRLNQDTFGLEWDYSSRQPEDNQFSESYKIALFWTHTFGQGAETPPVTAAYGTGTTPPPALPLPPETKQQFDLLSLSPGLPIYQARQILENMGIKGGIEQGNAIIYEGKMMTEIDQRQRLVMIQDKGLLARTALLIDYQAGGRVDDFKQTFEEIKEILLKRYGHPATFYEKGDFNNDLAQNLANGEFLRNYEWHFPEGVVRLGIPRRTDRQVRIEIHFARTLPSIKLNRWGLEQVM